MSKFTAKNETRKASFDPSNRDHREARSRRRHVGSEQGRHGHPVYGAFGNEPKSLWNALVPGTSGTPK